MKEGGGWIEKRKMDRRERVDGRKRMNGTKNWKVIKSILKEKSRKEVRKEA